ncbi:MAG: DUF370 domain-containing protein [Parabacteroides sp.]|nr:DUF370 domain-containing protein [Parabacteroides sp.]
MKKVMLNIGNSVGIDSKRVICISPYNLSYSKRIIKSAEDNGTLFDVSGRNKRSSIILMEENMVYLSGVTPDTLRKRFDQLSEQV